MSEPVAVRFRDCACPGQPHDGQEGRDDGDVAVLRPYLGFAAGAEALRAMQEAGEDVNRTAELLGPVYLRHGPISWNLLDEEGDPVPCTPAAIEALSFADAYDLADRADDLYSGQILDPLVKRMRRPSATGPTNGSTPQTRRSSPARRSPRQRSSRNGSAASKPSGR